MPASVPKNQAPMSQNLFTLNSTEHEMYHAYKIPTMPATVGLLAFPTMPAIIGILSFISYLIQHLRVWKHEVFVS